MKVLVYNINGLKGFHSKGRLDALFEKFNDVDVFCFQEVKSQEADIEKILANYPEYKYISNSNKLKKGYAGTLILYKNNVDIEGYANFDLQYETDDIEMLKYLDGRVTMLSLSKYNLFNIYTPNSANKRHIRELFDKTLIDTLSNSDKDIVIVGDLNVCPTKYDYWGKYEKVIDTMPGLMQFEIDGYNKICESLNVKNAYRKWLPEGRDYTYYPNSKEQRNLQDDKGWILDHVLVSDNINITSYRVYSGYNGEDHSPILIEIE